MNGEVNEVEHEPEYEITLKMSQIEAAIIVRHMEMDERRIVPAQVTQLKRYIAQVAFPGDVYVRDEALG